MKKAKAASRHLIKYQSMPTLGLACAVILMVLGVLAWSMEPLCQQDDVASHHLTLNTSAGPMEIRLYPEAAPNSVARLMTLFTEPLVDAVAVQSADEAHYYDGLTFDFTRPHLEIRTSSRPSVDVEFAQEIDADALGLDKERISTMGDAMNVMQDELLPAFRSGRRAGAQSAQLEQWIKTWYEDHEADFLVGVSRKQINAALGYSYTQGLASQPVHKGSVSLLPKSVHLASPILSIALNDLPQRTGRWTVVGEVVQGLDLADRISGAPLEKPMHVRSRTYKPLDPVVIESIDILDTQCK